MGNLKLKAAIAGNKKEAKMRVPPEEVTPQKLRELAIEEGYRKIKKGLVSRSCAHVFRTVFDEDTVYILTANKERLVAEGFTVEVEENVADGDKVHRYVLIVKW